MLLLSGWQLFCILVLCGPLCFSIPGCSPTQASRELPRPSSILLIAPILIHHNWRQIGMRPVTNLAQPLDCQQPRRMTQNHAPRWPLVTLPPLQYKIPSRCGQGFRRLSTSCKMVAYCQILQLTLCLTLHTLKVSLQVPQAPPVQRIELPGC